MMAWAGFGLGFMVMLSDAMLDVGAIVIAGIGIGVVAVIVGSLRAQTVRIAEITDEWVTLKVSDVFLASLPPEWATRGRRASRRGRTPAG